MRIAQIAPLDCRIPPKKSGGTERVISALTEELVKRGHEVTLFASGDSKTSARLISVSPTALSSRETKEKQNKIFDIYEHNAMNILNIGMAYRMQDEFDIIHDHTSQNYPASLALANSSSTPVVITLHGAFTKSTTTLFSFFNNPYYVSISKAQAKAAPHLTYMGNVYHGLNMEYFPFKAHSKGYLLFSGRISVEKGVHHAIRVAKILNLPLIIAGSVDSNYKSYMRDKILPHLSDQIRWVGEVDEKKRNSLMSNALCLLHPVTWPEPFGLSMIEAMACGCPVIAYSIGSIPEIVVPGETGFVVRTISDMVKAVQKVHTIDRLSCRTLALNKFSVKNMVDGYEAIYNRILSDHKEKFIRAPKTLRPINANGKLRNGNGLYLHE